MNIIAYNKLRKYEDYLSTASKANYIRSLTNSQMEDLIAIADSIGIKFKNNHCPKCTLGFMKRLAVPYFEQKSKLEEKQNEKKREKETDEA